MARILIAEDEPRISAFVEKGLSANGFTVTVVGDGPSAYDYAMTGGFDLMILDIGLPGIDGFAVLRKLRAERNPIPVIVLTTRDTVQDTVAGLEGGADDYMPQAIPVRRTARPRSASHDDRAANRTQVLSHGGLHLDLRTRRARVDDHTVDPSAREFALAETFVRHPGQVLSREHLVSHVRGYDFDPGSNVVDVYVRYLRRKTRHGPVCHAAWNGLPAGRSSLNTRRSSSSPTGTGELGWFHRNVLR
jgi:two-component system copper resistance phosphate regulon response regulator CusR